MNITIHNTFSDSDHSVCIGAADKVRTVLQKIATEVGFDEHRFDLWAEGELLQTRGPEVAELQFMKHVFVSPDSVFELRQRDYSKELIGISKAIGPTEMAAAIACPEMLECEDVCVKVVERCPAFFLSGLLPDKMNNSTSVVTAAIKSDGTALRFASDKLRDSKSVVLDAVTNRGIALKYASVRLKNDISIVREAVVIEGDALEFASSECQQNLEIAELAVSKSWRALEYVSTSVINSNKDLVLRAVTSHGMALQFAADHKKDFDVVMAAVCSDGEAIKFAEIVDRQILWEACSRYSRALRYRPDQSELITKDVCMHAVSHYGTSLRYVPRYLFEKDLIAAAVENNPGALFMTPGIDKQICCEIIENSASVANYWKNLHPAFETDLQLCAKTLRRRDFTRPFRAFYLWRELPDGAKYSKEVLMALADIGATEDIPPRHLLKHKDLLYYAASRGASLERIPRKLMSRDLVLLAVTERGRNLEYVPDKFKSDKEIVLAAASEAQSIQHANGDVISDKDFVKEFIRNCTNKVPDENGEIDFYTNRRKPILRKGNGDVLQYLPMGHRNDKSIVMLCVQFHGSALQHASEELQADREVVLAAVKSDPMSLCFACEDLQNDFDLVLVAVSINGTSLEFASPSLQQDIRIVLPAVTNDGLALEFAGPEMRDNPEVIITAISNTWLAFTFASNHMKVNWEGNPVFQAAKKIRDPRATIDVQPLKPTYDSWVNCVMQIE